MLDATSGRVTQYNRLARRAARQLLTPPRGIVPEQWTTELTVCPRSHQPFPVLEEPRAIREREEGARRAAARRAAQEGDHGRVRLGRCHEEGVQHHHGWDPGVWVGLACE